MSVKLTNRAVVETPATIDDMYLALSGLRVPRDARLVEIRTFEESNHHDDPTTVRFTFEWAPKPDTAHPSFEEFVNADIPAEYTHTDTGAFS